MIVNHFSWLMVLTSLFFSTSGVHADTEGDIGKLIEEFGDRCAEVMESPEDFYRFARAEENENNIAVMQSEDGQIHWILQIDRQPEFSSVFIEIDGKTQVTCSYFIGTDAHQEATDRHNNVFLAAISELNGARVTGGAIDVDGNLSALSGDPHTFYDYAIDGWPGIEQVVLGDVSDGIIRLAIVEVLPRQLTLR